MALFKSYFGGAFDEDAIRNNFVLIYELLDGMNLEPAQSTSLSLGMRHWKQCVELGLILVVRFP